MTKLARFRPGSTAPLRQAIGDLPRGTAQARAYPGRAGATGPYWLGTEGQAMTSSAACPRPLNRLAPSSNR